jgi:hypothetical protein
VVSVDGDLVGREVRLQGDVVRQRGHHGLQLVPLAEQGGGPAQDVLDALGATGVGRLVVGVEGEGARVEPQKLEDHFVGRRPVHRPVGRGVYDGAPVKPHAPLAAVAVDPQATGLRRRGQQPQDVRE